MQHRKIKHARDRKIFTVDMPPTEKSFMVGWVCGCVMTTICAGAAFWLALH